MSVYRPKTSPYYHYDFQWRGDRFHGSTRETERRKAEAVEEAERARVRQRAKAARAAATSLQIDDIADRYWLEVGQHHAGHKDTQAALKRLVEYFGQARLLTEISDDDVAKLVAWRRGQRVARRSRKPRPGDAPPPPLVSNATVNRSTTEVLKKLFTRAKMWGVRFEREPDWKKHWLPEPVERVRELVGGERGRLEAATREDHGPFFAFAHATGLRLRECLLRWSEVDWNARQIRKTGKGGRLVTAPITPAAEAILRPLIGHHPEFVFTYVARRTRKPQGLVKGQRYPLTYAGAKVAWKRLRRRAGVLDFRFHDFRHDLGTKLLRQTGNLKLVQKALNHGDLKVTAKYAHVLDQEVATALAELQEHKTPAIDTAAAQDQQPARRKA